MSDSDALTEQVISDSSADGLIRLKLYEMKGTPRDGERKHLLRRINSMFDMLPDDHRIPLLCLMVDRVVTSSNYLFYSEALELIDRFYQMPPEGIRFDKDKFYKEVIQRYVK